MLITRPVAHDVGRACRRRARNGDTGDQPDEPHHRVAGNSAHQVCCAICPCKHRFGIDALHRRKVDIRPQQKRNPENHLHEVDLHEVKDVVFEYHEEQRHTVFRHIHLAVIAFARLTVIHSVKKTHFLFLSGGQADKQRKARD